MTGLDAEGRSRGAGDGGQRNRSNYVDKVTDAGLLDAFKGQNAPGGFVLGETVDGVSQATKTSRGVVSGVNLAVRYYETYLKGGEPG